MKKPILTLMLGTLMTTATAAQAQVSESCQDVRFAEVGWTDIQATTGMARVLLDKMGYDTDSKTVSVPIAYAGLKQNDFDVFLGNWMPSMASIVKPDVESGAVETVTTNLKGAKYTLAVPSYVAKAGVTSFADLIKHKSQFHGRIYGLESGNDGNKIVENMIHDNAFGLRRFRLVASSEAGMLSEVKHAVQNKEWVIFLAWAPHPMNTKLDITYLKGGDKYFGPDYGAAVVRTQARKGYVQACPNVGHFLNNLTFTVDMENHLMDAIMNDHKSAKDAAKAYIAKHPEVLKGWLDGVKNTDGSPALSRWQ